MQTCLKPGKYTIVVFTAERDRDDPKDQDDLIGIFNNFPCGTQNDYWITLSCSDTCKLGRCCGWDGNCYPDVSERECRELHYAIGEIGDLDTAPKDLAWVAGGSCPDSI